MNEMEVCRLFASMAGIPMEEAMRQLPLVKLAVTEVSRRLTTTSLTQEQWTKILYACAAQACYQYLLIQSAVQPQGSFSAGGVSVERDCDSALGRAARLREEFFSLAGYLLRDEEGDFYFSLTGKGEKDG